MVSEGTHAAVNDPISLEIWGTTALGAGADQIALKSRFGLKTDGLGGTTLVASLASIKKEGIGLRELIKSLNNSAQIPGILDNLPKFQAFRIEYGSAVASNNFSLSLRSSLKVSEELPAMEIMLEYYSSEAEKDGKKTITTNFGGTIQLAGHSFLLSFLEEDGKSYLLAKYALAGDLKINFKDIARTILGEDDFPDIQLDIQKPNVFFLWAKEEDKSKVLFGMGAGLGSTFNLENLPLVGETLNDPNKFNIDEVLVMYANDAISAQTLGTINKKVLSKHAALRPLPEIEIAKGFNFSTSLMLNGELSLFSFDSVVDRQEDTQAITLQADKPKAPVGIELPGVTWKQVDKTLGPVTLQRIGFAYKSGKLTLLLDAGIKISGLSAQLVGLGFAFKIQWPPDWPDVYLTGLGIAYTSPAFSASGMFLNAPPKETEEFAFYGAAGFSTKTFSIAGMGAYSKLKTGTHSLFLYAMYQGPIGGPAFFFVTGIALGFGINRRVRSPAIDEVRDFPLVAMALNPDPKKTLNDMLMDLVNKDWIPSSEGDYWLAVGIRFTSFKLVDSFLMLIVGFGNRFDVTILGLSVLAWPSRSNSIVYIELVVKAHFATDSDVITVEGQLTPNSFLLDQNCHLTGGFAFYVWVSGPQEGDFVITMGGYHPKYKVPDHYPRVDRLGLNWKIGPLSIRGEMYFALTPQCIMMGGMLIAEYKLSFLAVTFTYWFDAFISWAPFQYDLSGGVRLAISLTIKILGVKVHKSISFGAKLQLFGPPFAGKIDVDLGFFSFTIPFGEGKQHARQNLLWSSTDAQTPGFLQSFVPLKAQKIHPIDARITAGILDVVKDSNGNVASYLVNAYDLVLAVDSFFPLTEILFKNGQKTDSLIGAETLMLDASQVVPRRYATRNLAFGVLPMAHTTLQSQLSFCLNKEGDKTNCVPSSMVLFARSKSISSALWAQVEGSSDALIRGTATGFELHTTEKEDAELLLFDVQRKQNTWETPLTFQEFAPAAGAFRTFSENHEKTTQVMDFFNGFGFDLATSENLDFYNRSSQLPLFGADIGQNLPSKIF